MTDIALRDTTDSQPLQFALAVHGQHKEVKFQVSLCRYTLL